jgi:hypothetical protein
MPSFSDRRSFSNFFGAMVGRLMARWRHWMPPDRYRPEKHYMRGPGPKNPRNSDKAESGDSQAT